MKRFFKLLSICLVLHLFSISGISQGDFFVFYSGEGNFIQKDGEKQPLERGVSLLIGNSISLEKGPITVISRELMKRVTVHKARVYDFEYFEEEFEKVEKLFVNKYLCLVMDKIKTDKDERVSTATAVTRGFFDLFKLCADDLDHRAFTVASPVVTFHGVLPSELSIAILDGTEVVARAVQKEELLHSLDLGKLEAKRFYLAILKDGKVQGKVVIRLVDEEEQKSLLDQTMELKDVLREMEMSDEDLDKSLSEIFLFQGMIHSSVYLD
jgi:hypothetical protein